MQGFNCLFITNVPEIAKYAEESGVSRIFLDLEIMGKIERQGHLDTVISHHHISDIKQVKSVLTTSKLMVRINPLHKGSKKEIDDVIDNGTDIIMLPMFHSAKEVKIIGDMINRRVKFIPLIETESAAKDIFNINALDCVDELHIGLNDLHLDLNKKFMFELFIDGTVDNIVSKITKPFGIGGVARIGEGIIPAENVLNEHVRLGSSGTILSRAFHLRSKSLHELKLKINLKDEINKLDNYLSKISILNDYELNEMHDDFIIKINDYIKVLDEKNI